VEAIRHFESLLIETEDRFIFQPCVSPIWDTAICAFALGEAGMPDDARMTRAADWLISKEVRRKGDWSVKRPDTEPSGWAFEFANEFYPDIDDTAMVLLALLHAKASNPEAQAAAERRAINWLLAMQSGDGGWAAFDVDNNWAVLNEVPFADHNAMLDPTCPDITGRVLESLCRRGMAGHEAVRRGVAYLLGAQEKDGSWYGRWGVNYIYGSFLAMRGLAASGAPEAGRHRQSRTVAADHPESRWRLGRILRQLRPGLLRSRAELPLADRLGRSGPAGRRRPRVAAVRRGIQFLLDRQTARRHMARGSHHRHRLPQRVLPHLRHVPRLLPAAGARAAIPLISPPLGCACWKTGVPWKGASLRSSTASGVFPEASPGPPTSLSSAPPPGSSTCSSSMRATFCADHQQSAGRDIVPRRRRACDLWRVPTCAIPIARRGPPKNTGAASG
jgi:hypothetical protein